MNMRNVHSADALIHLDVQLGVMPVVSGAWSLCFFQSQVGCI